MPSEIPFSVLLQLLEAYDWTLTRVCSPYRIFTKPGRLPIWLLVHERKVRASDVRKIHQILAAEDEEGPAAPGDEE